MTTSALPQLARALLERLEAQRSLRLPSFEAFCTSADYCGFTGASRIQRALMQAADGLQPDLTPDELEEHFGSRTFVNPCRPSVIVIECGVRAAKSLIAAFGQLHNTLTADVSVARPGELVKAFVTAPMLRQTRATFSHVKGTALAAPNLRALVQGEPNKEDLVLRRPDGVTVELAIVAAAPDGSNLRSTWVTSAVISEAAFFDDDLGAVNLEQQIIALRGRMLPRAQIWVESSPTTDTDPFHKLVLEYLGKPRDGVLAFRSDSFSMFPALDPAGERQLRAYDPDKADREYYAIPTSSHGTEFFPAAAIQAAVNRERDLKLQPNGAPHWGGTDLGFRKNSSTLALARFNGGKTVVAYYEELRPKNDEPLKPSEVCGSFARTAMAYQCFRLRGDDYATEFAREGFEAHTKRYPNGDVERMKYDGQMQTPEAKTEDYTEFRRLLLEGRLELPNDPVLLTQLSKVKSRLLPGGRIQIVLPKEGWTHGDVVEAVVKACVQVQERSAAASWIQAMRVQGSGAATSSGAVPASSLASARFARAMRAFRGG